MTTYKEHSFWLLPAEPICGQLRKIVRNLAAAHDTVDFEPHMTISCGVAEDQEVIAIANAITNQFTQQYLTATRLDHTAIYTKTLFIQFAASNEAQKISDFIKDQSSRPSSYVLNPHISLLYKTLSSTTQTALYETVQIPNGAYCFDRLRIIESEIPLTQREQIKRWRTVYECDLRPAQSFHQNTPPRP